MKQNITIDNLNELSEKGKERLREWWKPKEFDLYISKYGHEVNGWEVDNDGCVSFDEENKLDKVNDGDSKWEKCYPILSIGQMIEFLDEHNRFKLNIYHGVKPMSDGFSASGWFVEAKNIDFGCGELCDALFNAVKEVLENEK